jgi:hypothetical protein
MDKEDTNKEAMDKEDTNRHLGFVQETDVIYYNQTEYI